MAHILRAISTSSVKCLYISAGKYVVLARRHGDNWYLAAVNATGEPLKLKLDLPMFAGKTVSSYSDDKHMQPQVRQQNVKSDGKFQLTVQPQGGFVLKNN